MIRNERVCDLCACAVPNEPPHIDEFSTLTLIGGSAANQARAVIGRSNSIDLCSVCAARVVQSLKVAKDGHVVKAAASEVVPAAAGLAAPEAAHEAAGVAPELPGTVSKG